LLLVLFLASFVQLCFWDTRLSSAAERERLRAEGQAGFPPEKSTVDHVFFLRYLIEAAQGDYRRMPLYFSLC
jgi:hypothetical protein